ncbi:MAG: hypothetical protein JW715_02330 [Sedimentisphaerales bacterium]|nr:hypothetical protein [Sedimentisphaerales bacterium]
MVKRMEKANEQRAEQRLNYHWPLQFTNDDKQKAISGQIVDISSQGIAFLCHADEYCPKTGQLLKTNFGVPHFDNSDSFDTVFFNRTGLVHRLDELSSRINRVVVRFKEPLFFKPGEQNISIPDAQNRLEAKSLSIVQAEEKVKVFNEALTRVEEKMNFYAETKEKAEAKAQSETRARAKAEARAKSEAELRKKAEKRAKTEAERRAKVEAEAQKKAELYAEEIARLKTEKTQAIAQIRAKATEIPIEEQPNIKGHDKIKNQDKKTLKNPVIEKVDKFIKDRNKIF